MAEPKSVTILNGSSTVVGYLTDFSAAEGDLFVSGGAVGVIESREGPYKLNLRQPWNGPNITDSVKWDVLALGPYWRTQVVISKSVTEMLRRWDIAAPFKFDAFGTPDQRGLYDDQDKGFVYLSLEGLEEANPGDPIVGRVRMYIKLLNTNQASDWSQPIAIGAGGQVDFEDALAAEHAQRIESESNFSDRIGGFEVTATNLTTALQITTQTLTQEISDRQALGTALVQRDNELNNAIVAVAGRATSLETFRTSATQSLTTLSSTIAEETRQRIAGDDARVLENQANTNRIVLVENRTTNLETFQTGATTALSTLSATATEEANQRIAGDNAGINYTNAVINDLTTARNRISNLETFRDSATQALTLNSQTLQSEIDLRTQGDTYLTTESQKSNARIDVNDGKLRGRGYRFRAMAARPNVPQRDAYYDNSGGFAIYTFGLRTQRRVPKPGQIWVYPAYFVGSIVINVSIYIRTNEDSTKQGGQETGDVLMYTYPYLLTSDSTGANLINGSRDLVGSPAQKFMWQTIKLDLAGMVAIDEDKLLVFKIEYIGGDGITRVPVGQARGQQTVAAVKPIYKGMRATPANPNALLALDTANDTIPYVFCEQWEAAAFGGAQPPPLSTRVTSESLPVPRWTGTTMTIPEMVIERSGGPLVIPSQPLVFTAPKQEVAIQRITLQYAYLWNIYHQDFVLQEVKRVSDGGILTAGVHFALDVDSGGLIGLDANNPSFLVDVKVLADFQRYDLVYADPNVGGSVIVKGTDRGGDVNEYQPKVPSGGIPLFKVHVTRSKGLTVLPSYNWDGLALIGSRDEFLSLVEYNRKALTPAWRALENGELDYCAYGDSIVAQGTGYPTTANPNAFYTPNGDSRDNRDYWLTNRFPADTLDIIAPVDASGHTRTGYNFPIMDAMERSSGVRPNYYNMGIGGTHSGTGTRGGSTADNGTPDGMYPNRVYSVCNLKRPGVPMLVNISFGMGEIGLDFTYSTICAMIDIFDSQGIMSMVSCVPLPNLRGFRTAPLDNWRRTNANLVQAAKDKGKAYLPFHHWVDPINAGAAGFAYAAASNANALNHPGRFELDFYGSIGAAMVPPTISAVQRFLRVAGEPTAAHIMSGSVRDVQNTTTGRISRYANVNGTVVDLNKIDVA